MNNKQTPSVILADAALRREIPQTQFEYADVTFQAADTDTIIPYNRIKVDDPDNIRWLDVTPGAVFVGGVDSIPKIYQSSAPTRKLRTTAYVVLRSTVAGYRTRLLLFTERES